MIVSVEQFSNIYIFQSNNNNTISSAVISSVYELLFLRLLLVSRKANLYRININVSIICF